MARAAQHATGCAPRAPLRDRADDCYETPDVATRALLRVENLPRRLWEPACGPGAIVRILRDAGHEVVASDLCEYGCPDSTSRVDFLMETRAPDGVECIVTNPPYKLAGEFVEHALRLCPLVVMLLRLAFIESVSRSELLDRGKLARIYPFSRRLPTMHRRGWDGPLATSAIAFAWFTWDTNHDGPTALRRIDWKAGEVLP